VKYLNAYVAHQNHELIFRHANHLSVPMGNGRLWFGMRIEFSNFTCLAPVSFYLLRILGLLSVNYFASASLLKVVWKTVFLPIDSCISFFPHFLKTLFNIAMTLIFCLILSLTEMINMLSLHEQMTLCIVIFIS